MNSQSPIPIVPGSPGDGPQIPRVTIRALLLVMNGLFIGAAVIFATLMIIIWAGFTFRDIIIDSLKSHARIIGYNCAAALTFRDAQAAEESLASLKFIRAVVSGDIHDKDGKLFAWYRRDLTSPVPPPPDLPIPSEPRLELGLSFISVVEPIAFKGPPHGVVHLQFDTLPFLLDLVKMGFFLLLLGGGTILSVTVLFNRRITLICDPILNLIRTMEIITKDKDYSRRVPVSGSLESATLAARFNDLLKTTEEWWKEVSEHRENLENLVEIRTVQWKEAASELHSELEERRRTETELQKRTRELALARDAADVANRAKSDFLANMSHEIRTPLSAILGFSSLLELADLPRREGEFVRKIQVSGDLLLGIIDDILDFAKIEAGKLKVARSEFELDELLLRVAMVTAPRLRARGLEFDFDISPAVPGRLLGDPQRLGQILINLLGNAAKFTERGGVELQLEVLGTSGSRVNLEFQVNDTGIGMTDEQLAGIFQPFAQVDGATSRKFGGTGLGLSICKNLVGLMEGEISVQSDPDAGSSFRFTCWVEDATLEEGAKQALPELLTGLRVLHVSSSESPSRGFSRALQRTMLRTTPVDSYDQVLPLLGAADPQDPYRLVLLESRKVSDDECELIEAIRLNSSLAPAPGVVMICAIVQEDEKERLFEAGVDDILQKPFPISTLVTLVGEMFGAGENPDRVEPPMSEVFSHSLGGIRVLIGEDNDFNREILQELLEGWGAEVESADNGQKVVAAVLNRLPGTFDVVLLDVQMPEMDGLTAIRLIRADLRFKDLSVVAMTAHVFPEEQKRLLEAGMDDYVGKPIDPGRLREVFARHIRPVARQIELIQKPK